jgi:hypothetical protein
MTKVVIKLSIEFFFEYTNDEHDAIWIDSIKRLIESKLFSYNIVLSGDDFIFPLNGRDLQNLNIAGKAIGDAIKKAKDYWHTNNNMPNKLELINYLSKK